MRLVHGKAILALALLVAACGAQASSIERFESYLRTTQSATADFEQKVFDRDGKLVQDARGTFAFLRPGRFRWIYQSPTPQVIVGDGTRVWIYDEDLKQVTVRGMARAIGSTPAALLSGSADVKRAFRLSEGGVSDGLEWLDALPRDKDSGFQSIRLGLGVAGVEAMVLVDHFGQTTQLRFTGIVRNPKLDVDTFRFTPPKGVDVLGEP